MRVRTAIRAIVSVLLGVVLLMPLAAFYELAHLPVFHSWGLMHGSLVTAVPALTAITFIALGLVPWFGPSTDPSQRIVASILVFPLVTLIFWANQKTSYADFSAWHAVIYAGIFSVLVLLCVRAQKPLLVPLFLLVPIFLDPFFGLLVVGPYDIRGGLAIFTSGVISNVLPVLIASVVALLLARYVRRTRSDAAPSQ